MSTIADYAAWWFELSATPTYDPTAAERRRIAERLRSGEASAELAEAAHRAAVAYYRQSAAAPRVWLQFDHDAKRRVREGLPTTSRWGDGDLRLRDAVIIVGAAEYLAATAWARSWDLARLGTLNLLAAQDAAWPPSEPRPWVAAALAAWPGSAPD